MVDFMLTVRMSDVLPRNDEHHMAHNLIQICCRGLAAKISSLKSVCTLKRKV